MRIWSYRGYSTRTRVFLTGRVVANETPGARHDSHSIWRRLLDTYRRFNTDEVPNLPVTVRFGSEEQTFQTDRDGYYHAELPRREQSAEPWLTAEARCRIRGRELSATHDVVAPTAEAEFGVISDLDDTVIETNMTSIITAAKLTFMGSAKTRKPLEGVAALYASFVNGNAGRPVNPIFYASSSPWNLYDLLCAFLELNDIPPGPIYLRDWGIDRTKFIAPRGHREKLERALKIISDFPELPFVLVGDSGQQDASLYAEAAALHPDRIKAIYIRDIDPATASRRDDDVRERIKTAAAHGVPMLLASDSDAMAQHAVELGLIPARKEAEVHAEVEKDHDRPHPASAAVAEAFGIDSSPGK